MGSFSIWHWLIVLAVVLLLFGGRGKISQLMGDFGKGLNAFKKGVGAATDETTAAAPPRPPADAAPEVAATPIAVLLASADAAAGEGVFKKCASCHTVDKGGANKVGPNLYGLVDRPIASHEGFSYSAAMTEFAQGGSVLWTWDHLNEFLLAPKQHIPGTAMGFAGTSNTMSWYLHVSQGGRASALWYSVSAARPTNGRPCDWFDTHPDLYLRIIADGISNNPTAINFGIFEYD